MRWLKAVTSWYSGGDFATQQDGTKNAFLKQFPKMNVTLVMDYSKDHDVRLDNQFKTNSVVPDVISLQTVQDFPRWATLGKLLSTDRLAVPRSTRA